MLRIADLFYLVRVRLRVVLFRKNAVLLLQILKFLLLFLILADLKRLLLVDITQSPIFFMSLLEDIGIQTSLVCSKTIRIYLKIGF